MELDDDMDTGQGSIDQRRQGDRVVEVAMDRGPRTGHDHRPLVVGDAEVTTELLPVVETWSPKILAGRSADGNLLVAIDAGPDEQVALPASEHERVLRQAEPRGPRPGAITGVVPRGH